MDLSTGDIILTVSLRKMNNWKETTRVSCVSNKPDTYDNFDVDYTKEIFKAIEDATETY